MAKFLTTNAGIYHLEEIILSAKNNIFLFSPYLCFSKTLFERLKDSDSRNLKITIVYGKSELKPVEKRKLFSLNNLKLYYFENLHAKCYFNESSMIITSMNIYAFSEKNNREMGILLDCKQDLKAFTHAYQEATSILKNSSIVELVEQNFSYCIRCATILPLNIAKPLCLKCYRQWAKFKNPNYIEKYCHGCGDHEVKNNLDNPLCKNCLELS